MKEKNENGGASRHPTQIVSPENFLPSTSLTASAQWLPHITLCYWNFIWKLSRLWYNTD